MKASFAKQIKVTADELIEINKQKKLRDQRLEKIKVRRQKEILKELEKAYLPVEEKLADIRSFIVDAVVEGRCFVAYSHQFFDELLREVNSYTSQCELHGYIKSRLPCIFQPFQSFLGYGIFDPQEIIEKFNRKLINLQKKYDAMGDFFDYEREFFDYVLNALKEFDISKYPKIESVDVPIIEEYIEKIEKNQSLNREELLAAISILGGNLQVTHQKMKDEKIAELTPKARIGKSISKYNRIKRFFEETEGYLVLCWDANLWMKEVIEEEQIYSSQIFSAPLAKEDLNSTDILSNPDLLSWFGSLYEADVYQNIFDCIKYLSQNSIAHCSITVSDSSLKLTSAGRTIKECSFHNSMPLRRTDQCEESWRMLFKALEYDVASCKSEGSFVISW